MKTELRANVMKKCKHFLMMVAYIKEQVSKRLITIEKIPTKLNPADILSKPTYYGSGFVNKRNKALGSCDTMDIDDSMQIVGENENGKERSEK
jgi:hypothetical protein